MQTERDRASSSRRISQSNAVKHPEEKEMYEIERSARRLFLHKNLWDKWSRGLSFVKEMGVVETTCTKRNVSCADLSRHLCFPDEKDLVSGRDQSASSEEKDRLRCFRQYQCGLI